jgi:hypothetical protein
MSRLRRIRHLLVADAFEPGYEGREAERKEHGQENETRSLDGHQRGHPASCSECCKHGSSAGLSIASFDHQH